MDYKLSCRTLADSLNLEAELKRGTIGGCDHSLRYIFDPDGLEPADGAPRPGPCAPSGCTRPLDLQTLCCRAAGHPPARRTHNIMSKRDTTWSKALPEAFRLSVTLNRYPFVGSGVDKDPKWRSQAVYARDEAETLISDERIPADRRMYYGSMLLAGMRSGEIAALRCRTTTRQQPLGRLTVALALITRKIDHQGHEDGRRARAGPCTRRSPRCSASGVCQDVGRQSAKRVGDDFLDIDGGLDVLHLFQEPVDLVLSRPPRFEARE